MMFSVLKSQERKLQEKINNKNNNNRTWLAVAVAGTEGGGRRGGGSSSYCQLLVAITKAFSFHFIWQKCLYKTNFTIFDSISATDISLKRKP